MLVRFALENILSYGKKREFTTIADKRLKTLCHHKIDANGFQLLKVNSIYGANASGKSNFVEALRMLQKLVTGHNKLEKLHDTRFKLCHDINQPQTLMIEFIQAGTRYFYILEFALERVLTEELYVSGMCESEDRLVFARKTNPDETFSITFSPEFENDEKSQMLKSIILEEFIDSGSPIMKFLANRENEFLSEIKSAYTWFSETLQIICPKTETIALAQLIRNKLGFKQFAETLMKSLNLGIHSLDLVEYEMEEYFGKNQQETITNLTKIINNSPNNTLVQAYSHGSELIIREDNGKVKVLKLMLGHKNALQNEASFDFAEESDGTIRLLEFVPMFQYLANEGQVFVVDEIERSIHPLLIKELLRKFGEDKASKGQLIFTTHESNLLDQDIFRTDEIWFTEKDLEGSTDLYSLNDYKEHKSIDIRKGYLSGRYGSIPFLANLRDLNWHNNDPA